MLLGIGLISWSMYSHQRILNIDWFPWWEIHHFGATQPPKIFKNVNLIRADNVLKMIEDVKRGAELSFLLLIRLADPWIQKGRTKKLTKFWFQTGQTDRRNKHSVILSLGLPFFIFPPEEKICDFSILSVKKSHLLFTYIPKRWKILTPPGCKRWHLPPPY